VIDGQLSLDGVAVGVDQLEAIVVFPLDGSPPVASWSRRGAAVSTSRLAEVGLKLALVSLDDSFAGDDAVTLSVESQTTWTQVHCVRGFGVAIVFAREAPLGFVRMAARQIAATLAHDLPNDAPRPSLGAPPVPGLSTQGATSVEPPPRVTIAPPTPSVAGASVSSAPAVALVPPARVDVPPPTPSEATLRSVEPSARVAPPPAPSPPPPDSSRPSTIIGEAPVPQVDFDSDPAPDTSPPRSAIGHRVRAILSHLEQHAVDPHISRLRVALKSGLGLEVLVYPDDLPAEALVVIETAAEDILGIEHGRLGEIVPS
jgi:hypothetical protein